MVFSIYIIHKYFEWRYFEIVNMPIPHHTSNFFHFLNLSMDSRIFFFFFLNSVGNTPLPFGQWGPLQAITRVFLACPIFLSDPSLCSVTRCSVLVLYSPCPDSGISHLSQEACFLTGGRWCLGSRTLVYRYAHWYQDVCVPEPPVKRAGRCVCMYVCTPHMLITSTCLYYHGSVYIEKPWSHNYIHSFSRHHRVHSSFVLYNIHNFLDSTNWFPVSFCIYLLG